MLWAVRRPSRTRQPQQQCALGEAKGWRRGLGGRFPPSLARGRIRAGVVDQLHLLKQGCGLFLTWEAQPGGTSGLLKVTHQEVAEQGFKHLPILRRDLSTAAKRGLGTFRDGNFPPSSGSSPLANSWQGSALRAEMPGEAVPSAGGRVLSLLLHTGLGGVAAQAILSSQGPQARSPCCPKREVTQIWTGRQSAWSPGCPAPEGKGRFWFRDCAWAGSQVETQPGGR